MERLENLLNGLSLQKRKRQFDAYVIVIIGYNMFQYVYLIVGSGLYARFSRGRHLICIPSTRCEEFVTPKETAVEI